MMIKVKENCDKWRAQFQEQDTINKDQSDKMQSMMPSPVKKKEDDPAEQQKKITVFDEDEEN